MHVEWIQLVGFRNYRDVSFRPSATLNVLSGRNAQGKTNLLEGLAVLLVGRSFRGARPADFLRWDDTSALLAGHLRRGETARELRRTVTRRDDGAWALAGEGCAWARAVPFGWADLAVVNGAPQARRNFLDGFIGKLVPAHVATCGRYREVLARRNLLLQVGAPADRLEPWDAQLARLGLEITGRRRAAVVTLQRQAETLYPRLGGHGAIELEYRPAVTAEAGVDGFLAHLAARRVEEARRRQTLVGPHRDELRIEVDGREMRSVASRGQQRLLALTLRLAETGPVGEAVGSDPVLLLDDALSELDPEVQGRVLRHVEGLGQTFLTTAAETRAAARATRWEIRGGQVDERAREAVQGVA